ADLDGDGIPELLAGGRVGPFRPQTDPASSKHARVDLYRRVNGQMFLLSSSPELHVVEDIAAADLDGDGRTEILAIGAGRLVVLRWNGQDLSVLHTESLPENRAYRVDAADLDNDGRAEIAVALYRIHDGAERGDTRVQIYRWTTDRFDLQQNLDIPMHVGDLALAKGPALILETGTGEEGGTAVVFRLYPQHALETWQGPVTENSIRALNLCVLPGSHLVAIGPVSGNIELFTLDSNGLRFVAHGPRAHPLTGLLLLPDPGRAVEVLTGISGPRPSIRSTPFSF
ncbi:MAG: VCBS repeat-containing protein, partial [bacterium]|nr:VCBS repeat-containing protein [bacterium]